MSCSAIMFITEIHTVRRDSQDQTAKSWSAYFSWPKRLAEYERLQFSTTTLDDHPMRFQTSCTIHRTSTRLHHSFPTRLRRKRDSRRNVAQPMLEVNPGNTQSTIARKAKFGEAPQSAPQKTEKRTQTRTTNRNTEVTHELLAFSDRYR